MATVEAIDTDSGLNSTLTYTILATDLYRKGYDLPDSPVRPIPSPFSYEPDGRLLARQLMSQYPVGSRFVLHLEAREAAPPHRVAHTKLYIWIYDPTKLIKITVKQPPEEVHVKRDQLETILSNATDNRAIIIDIKYHFDQKRAKLAKEVRF